MKNVLATLALAVLAATAVAQQPAEQQPAQQPGTSAQDQQPQQKVIKDPTEYNAYIAAIGQQDPTAKATALEAFLAIYPNSIVKPEALEQLMAVYQQANNIEKAVDAADRLLEVQPNSVRALALVTFVSRASAEAGQNPQANLQKAHDYGLRGLQALQVMTKPPGMSDQDFDQLKTQTALIFNAAVGFAALQAKDYAGAQQHLQAAVDLNPTDLRNIYPLALAYFGAQPSQNQKGLWYVARAVALARNTPGYPPQAVQTIEKFGLNRYKVFHGGADGWQELVQMAGQQPTPPPDFKIKAAPTPAEIAHDTLQKYGVDKLNFADWEFILENGFPEDAQAVLNHMQGLGVVALEGKVVDATRDTLTMAVAPNKQDANAADVKVTLAKPAKTLPEVGTMLKFTGKIVGYDKSPLMINVDEGEFTLPPARRAVRRRRR